MLNAILPIFLLIVIGFAMRHYRLMSEAFWDDAEKLVYYVLFPSMLISKMSTADLSQTDAVPLIAVLWLGLACISILTFILKPLLNVADPSFGSVFQGAIRINTFIGLSLAENLFGNSALISAVIIAAILIPIINLLVVPVLHHCRNIDGDEKSGTDFYSLIKQIIKNPLIIGCVIGIALNILNIKLPSAMQLTLSLMGSTALPIGLMAVGAALVFKDLKSVVIPLLASSTLKLVIYPMLMYLLTEAFNFDQQTQMVIMIFAAVPTASSAYILAKNMGGDHQLMSRIITFQTLFSIVTFFIMFSILAS